MKWIPLIVLFVISLSFCTHSKRSATAAVLLNGTVLLKEDYCGGAEPGPDQLNPRPYPAGNTWLYFKKGNINCNQSPVDSVKTDSAGRFQLKLLPGKYCVVGADKKDHYKIPFNDQWNTWDTACYRMNWEKCEAYIELNKNSSAVNIVLERHCPWRRPCNSYRGPLPPAAQKPHNE